MTEAFEKALTNPKVITLLASLTAKEIVKSKSNPSNVEETLVRDHVVFAQKDSKSGVFMTTKEITEKILAFNDELTIRPRIFGKGLITEAVVTKDSNQGRVYFIEAVVEKITAELLDTISRTSAMETVVEGAEVIKPEDTLENQDSPLSIDDLTEMDLSELLEVKAAYDLKIKGAKKMEADELRAAISSIVWPDAKATTKEAPSISTDIIEALMAEYGDMADYTAMLVGFSRKKLIKHINKFKMRVPTEMKTEEEITALIIELIESSKPSVEIPLKEEPKEAKSEKKKDKKKKKKNKKAKD